MKLYACRWPNGDLSFVHAKTHDNAVVLLDEVGGAEGRLLFELRNFMVHLALDDTGNFKYDGIGDECEQQILMHAYPIIDKVYDEAVDRPEMEPSEEAMREAVRQERARLMPDVPDELME